VKNTVTRTSKTLVTGILLIQLPSPPTLLGQQEDLLRRDAPDLVSDFSALRVVCIIFLMRDLGCKGKSLNFNQNLFFARAFNSRDEGVWGQNYSSFFYTITISYPHVFPLTVSFPPSPTYSY
jgi:hypothetical protein